MSIAEIVTLARSMRDTLRNGMYRAWRYLKSLGLPAEFVVYALQAY